jgi:hypothetical protein
MTELMPEHMVNVALHYVSLNYSSSSKPEF